VDGGLGVVAAEPSDPRASALQVVDPAGATRRAVVRLGRDRGLAGHADLGPGAAVWVARGCASAQIRRLALPAGAVRVAPPACVLRLRRRPEVRGGRLRVGLSCAGFTVACSARVEVRARGRLLARGPALPNRSTPPYAAAGLPLTPAGTRLLRRGRPLRVELRARIADGGPGLADRLRTAPVRRATRTIVPR
jgi:hypothetical protein